MATINFTENLKRHLKCPPQQIPGETLSEILKTLLSVNQQLGSYIIDDQGRLRKHILISIDNQLITDRIYLTDRVKPDSEIYILQALSGG